MHMGMMWAIDWCERQLIELLLALKLKQMPAESLQVILHSLCRGI